MDSFDRDIVADISHDYSSNASNFTPQNTNKKSSFISNYKTKNKRANISPSENLTLQKYFTEVGREYSFNTHQELRFTVKIKAFESFYQKLENQIALYKKSDTSADVSNDSCTNITTNNIDRLRSICSVTKNSVHRYKSEFASSNLRLVISLAKNFSNRGVPYSDLIQEGNLGLLKAIDRYDPQKGYKFSTYASWWIQQSINTAILDQSRLIRLPVKIQEEFFKISKSRKSLSKETGKLPDAEQISNHMGIKKTKVQKVERAANLSVISLDTPKYQQSDEEGQSIQDYIPDKSDCVKTSLSQIELSNNITKALSQLTEREQNIISMRFGIGYNQNYTLDEIGNSYALTRERIRQIERNALSKIKNHPDGQILREYLS